MKLDNTYVLILAGGIGSRFWPLSRESQPKQFLDILGTGKSLLQSAYERYVKLVDEENIYIIANSRYIDLIKQHLPNVKNEQIMAEPFGKNTAPCVAYAAYKIGDINENANLIVAPSDHLILDEDIFVKQMEHAVNFAKENNVLVTLGIKPHRPDTGYGYIQYDETPAQQGIHKVITFTEKPPLEMAEKFLESGDFLWNSGMFVWSVKSIQKAFNDYLPEMNLIFQEGNGAYNTPIEFKHIEQIYSKVNSISIDNGVLEKADNVYVLPSDFGWSDLGTWKSVNDKLAPSGENKVLNAILHDINSKDNLIVTDTKKLVVLQDIEGLFIIDTDDALLICKNDQDQEVKKIATLVKKEFNGKYS